MATLTPSKITEAGHTSSLTTCSAAGDDFVNSGIEFIRIQNTHASATYSIKIEAQTSTYKNPQYGILNRNHIYKTVAAATNSAYFGPFKQGSFNNGNDKVKIYYKTGSGTTDTTWNALSTTLAGTHLLKIEVLYLDN